MSIKLGNDRKKYTVISFRARKIFIKLQTEDNIKQERPIGRPIAGTSVISHITWLLSRAHPTRGEKT